MLLNGHIKVQSTFSRVMGYVEQFDIHSPMVNGRGGGEKEGDSGRFGADTTAPWRGETKRETRGDLGEIPRPPGEREGRNKEGDSG